MFLGCHSPQIRQTQQVLSALKCNAIEPVEIDSRNKNLEALFLKLTRKDLRDT